MVKRIALSAPYQMRDAINQEMHYARDMMLHSQQQEQMHPSSQNNGGPKFDGNACRIPYWGKGV